MSLGPERNRGRYDRDREQRRIPYDRRDSRIQKDRDRGGRGGYGYNGGSSYIDAPDFHGDYIKVSAGSNVKSVAGKIAHSCREGDPAPILTIGATCINQAVKSIAVARAYLSQDNIDLTFQPAFRDPDRSKPSLALYVAKQQPVRIFPIPDSELPVSSNSQPGVVAGALAARVREHKSVCLTAIGVDAVANAVLAIGNTRLYLEQDSLDIRASPEFVHVKKNDTELSAVRFNIVIEKL